MATAQPPTRRRNYGKGHGYLLDGEKVRGVTTIINDAVPKPALTKWAAKTTAAYAVDHWDELAAKKISARQKELEDAPFDDRDAAARRGTEVHALAERLIHGEQITVPEELAGHVDSYVKFLNEWDPQPVLVEGIVFSAKYRYGGTLDMIADLADGYRWLVDIKTSRSGVFGETALQLAAYRYADFALGDLIDGAFTEVPMPEVDRTGVVLVRSDGYDLYPVDAGPEQFKIFQHAAWIGQRIPSLRDTIGDALRPPALPVGASA